MQGPRSATWQDGASRSEQRLQRIADVLGLPIGAFFTGSGVPTDLSQLGEILRLWSAIDRDSDRQRVLALMRDLAPDHADA